jgi:hypothetical protein
MGPQSALELAKSKHYPADCGGFRDYGSSISNLVVGGLVFERT